MKIDSYNITLHSFNEKISLNYEKLDLKILKKETENKQKDIHIHLLDIDIKNISLEDESMDEHELKSFLIKYLIEKLTGKEIKSLDMKDFNKAISSPSNIELPQFAAEINYEKIQYEKESVSFKASGEVRTKDGKNIKFDLTFSLNKEALNYTKLNIKAGSVALIDPLIINFDGNLDKVLSDTKFKFDLNNDGSIDKISTLTEGNGFLIFDKNNNEKVDNGSEMFGTVTGDGFEELSKYDDDKNNWIDENDSIFNKLKVWIKTGSSDYLKSLKEMNIGAIYLKNTDTSFTYEQNGKLQNSSIYLSERDNVGVIYKVDFFV